MTFVLAQAGNFERMQDACDVGHRWFTYCNGYPIWSHIVLFSVVAVCLTAIVCARIIRAKSGKR